jgi:WD40 repeat protein
MYILKLRRFNLNPSYNSKLFSLLSTLSESFSNLVSTRYPVPTDHHLFSANAPPLRTMAWHPHRTILAVAHEDHRIYVYEYNSTTNEWDTRILEHRYMADITSLDWKKYCHGTLAVGCRTGVCVWFLNGNSGSDGSDGSTSNHYDFMPTTPAFKPHHQRSANAYMHFFSTPGHHHISAVAWDPSIGSQTLAVASAVDSMLIMYDLLTFNHTPLNRNGKGNALLRWSPDGRYLYVGGL